MVFKYYPLVDPSVGRAWLSRIYYAGAGYYRGYRTAVCGNLSLTNLPGISDKPFWPCIERSFLAFITLSRVENICPGNLQIPDTLWEAFQLLIALFFFAAIVAYFTALVLRPKKLFQFKSTLNIRRDASGCDRLVCSVYAAPVTVTGLNIRIIARVRIDSNTLKNVVIRNGPPKQPLAEPYIPLRIFADLSKNGITISSVDADGYVERMSHRVTTDSKALEIEEFYIDMTGVMGNVEQSVFGEHWYKLFGQEIFFGEFASVDPDYKRARCNSGWAKRKPPQQITKHFDRNKSPLLPDDDAHYVFGYGSLVNPASFARTLGRNDWTMDDFPLATLKGYRRVWDVAMDNSIAIPGYKQYYRLDSNERPEIFVTFLNIEPSENDEVIGVLARVSDEELVRLERRERNYQRIDVSTGIVGGPCHSVVYTFIGTREARERFASGKASGTAVISRAYAENVEEAFRLRGRRALENYRDKSQSVEDSKLEVIDLRKETVQ